MNMIKTKYSQFSPTALLDVLKTQYDLPQDSACIFFKSGLNDIYKITARDSTYFLRVSLSGVYTTEQIAEELALIVHLRACGLSVVEPIPCSNSAYVLELSAPEGMRQAVLFRGIAQAPTGDANTLMRNLGALLAKTHVSSRTFQKHSVRPQIDARMLAALPTELLCPFLMHRPDDLAFLHETAMPLWSAAETLLSKYEDSVGFCHGDVQPNNYFFNGDQPVLFDFDCMGWGYYVYDLGVLLANLTFMDNEIDKKPYWISIIEGYDSIRPLHEEERKAIYIFAALHMLRVLSYHAKCREQNQGAFYFMTDHHLNTYFGAYKRLAQLAKEKAF